MMQQRGGTTSTTHQITSVVAVWSRHARLFAGWGLLGPLLVTACEGPGSPASGGQGKDFAPTSDTQLAAARHAFRSVTIPAWVTVTLARDALVEIAGDITIGTKPSDVPALVTDDSLILTDPAYRHRAQRRRAGREGGRSRVHR